MKYYIATTLTNAAEHNQLRDRLNAIGHEITYDRTTHGAVYSKGLERIKEVAVLETNAVGAADVVFVLMPGGKGTHVELGLALALKKYIIFVSSNENHHQATTETCAFYHHPSVRLIHSIEEIFPLEIEHVK